MLEFKENKDMATSNRYFDLEMSCQHPLPHIEALHV